MFYDPYKYNIANVEGLSIALNEKQLKTLASAITIDGRSYTQVEPTLNAIKDALDDRQKEDLSSPVTIGGVPQTTVEGAIGGLNDVKADLTDIAAAFDPTVSYAEGDYVTYDGSLYKCTTAHTGAWNSAHFTMTLVADEFGSGGSADITSIASAFSESTSYVVGQYVTYEGKLYKCTTNHSAGAWNANDFTETTVDAEYMAKGRDYVTAGKKSGTNIGTMATAEGYDNTASGNYSHAEGYSTIASGVKSHAEGNDTLADAYWSHAEGNLTMATHDASHAEGYYTKTGNKYQHVQGKYNEGKSTTAFEIGNGTGTSAANRSNALEVDWNGNVTAGGDYIDGDGMIVNGNMKKAPLFVAQNPQLLNDDGGESVSAGAYSFSVPNSSSYTHGYPGETSDTESLPSGATGIFAVVLNSTGTAIVGYAIVSIGESKSISVTAGTYIRRIYSVESVVSTINVNFIESGGGFKTNGNILPTANDVVNLGANNNRFYYGHIKRVMGCYSIEQSSANGTYRINIPAKAGTMAIAEEHPPYRYHEGFTASYGTTKTITGLTECRCYLVTWSPLYATGASRGAWLVFMSAVAGQSYIHTLSNIGCSLTVGANSVTFTYQYSGGADVGCLSCIEL